jgi:hypothetical protein
MAEAGPSQGATAGFPNQETTMDANESALRHPEKGDAGHQDGQEKGHDVVFFIGKKRYESPTADLTPRTILVEYAKEDPALTTLVDKSGDDPVELTDLDKPIHVKNGTHFAVFHNTPTTVS